MSTITRHFPYWLLNLFSRKTIVVTIKRRWISIFMRGHFCLKEEENIYSHTCVTCVNCDRKRIFTYIRNLYCHPVFSHSWLFTSLASQVLLQNHHEVVVIGVVIIVWITKSMSTCSLFSILMERKCKKNSSKEGGNHYTLRAKIFSISCR